VWADAVQSVKGSVDIEQSHDPAAGNPLDGAAGRTFGNLGDGDPLVHQMILAFGERIARPAGFFRVVRH
jgi:hypothetical protein